jgi:predicted transposase YbfD/YdcC
VPTAAAVLAQLYVDATTNEHKAALRLLGVLPLAGKFVAGDALFTRRDVAPAVRDGGGDYVLFVKDNQPELRGADRGGAARRRRLIFPYRRRQKAAEEQKTRTPDRGHGRREYRRLLNTTMLPGYLEWPGAAPVSELERVRVLPGKTEAEVAHGVTSLTRAQADAGRLLGLSRGHRGIENELHRVRDETLGEDRCRVRTGSSPQVLAAVRNVAVHLLEGVPAASTCGGDAPVRGPPQRSPRPPPYLK